MPQFFPLSALLGEGGQVWKMYVQRPVSLWEASDVCCSDGEEGLILGLMAKGVCLVSDMCPTCELYKLLLRMDHLCETIWQRSKGFTTSSRPHTKNSIIAYLIIIMALPDGSV